MFRCLAIPTESTRLFCTRSRWSSGLGNYSSTERGAAGSAHALSDMFGPESLKNSDSVPTAQQVMHSFVLQVLSFYLGHLPQLQTILSHTPTLASGAEN
jgi:hypothetical protein